MTQPSDPSKPPRSALYRQLLWFSHLRWLAGAVVLIGGLIDRQQDWFPSSERFVAIGAGILIYNAVLRLVLMRVPTQKSRGVLAGLALTQILLDLACLTTLTMWTGGVHSPLIGFFVFHMVFASLMLRQGMAYVTAGAAMVFLVVGLTLSSQWPTGSGARMSLIGAIVTIVLTVTLTNRITRDLRTQRRRLLLQNRRVRAISEELQRTQQTMIQHEKMVAMGTMAAGVTHEITNPLAAMDSVLQLAERRPDRPIKPETLQTLREQIARINQIIQQMKTFAHPADVQAQVLPLNDVVEMALEMVRFDKRMRRVQVKKDLDPHAGAIPMLAQALQQVMVNLIINALDAMVDAPDPILAIKTHRREGWCTIEVSDNGHGIESANMDRLFEPFFTTKPVGKGTGLGLSISYSLMQKQGGSISVRSQIGRGATFILRLPTDDASRNREQAGADIAATENPPA